MEVAPLAKQSNTTHSSENTSVAHMLPLAGFSLNRSAVDKLNLNEHVDMNLCVTLEDIGPLHLRLNILHVDSKWIYSPFSQH